MFMRVVQSGLTATLVTAMASVAFADHHETVDAEAGMTATGPTAGTIVVNAPIGVNLGESSIAEPIGIAPDIHYYVNEKLSVRLSHSNMAKSGFWTTTGKGICPNGEEGGCPKAYDGPGIDASFELSNDGKVSLAADGGLNVVGLLADEFTQVQLHVGAIAKLNMGTIMLDVRPNVFIGLNERDAAGAVGMIGAGGAFAGLPIEQQINLPVTASVAVIPQAHVAVQTGFSTPTSNIGDSYVIPVGVGGDYAINESITAFGMLNFPAMLGAEGVGQDVEAREIILGVKYTKPGA